MCLCVSGLTLASGYLFDTPSPASHTGWLYVCSRTRLLSSSGFTVMYLSLHLDIALLPCQRYIHWGSLRNFHFHNSEAITSFWSTICHPPRNAKWVVDHTALASQARSANTTKDINIPSPPLLTLSSQYLNSCLFFHPDDLVCHYNNTFNNCLVSVKTVTFSQTAPCFTPDLASGGEARSATWVTLQENWSYYS